MVSSKSIVEGFILIQQVRFQAGEVILLQSSSGEEVILLKCSKCNGLQQVNLIPLK